METGKASLQFYHHPVDFSSTHLTSTPANILWTVELLTNALEVGHVFDGELSVVVVFVDLTEASHVSCRQQPVVLGADVEDRLLKISEKESQACLPCL